MIIYIIMYILQLIESKMEQFKICEKETKTKAYSKEGLAREEKPDPQEAERQEKLTWLNNVVDRLREIVESQESDLEKLSNVKKGKNREQVSTLSTYQYIDTYVHIYANNYIYRWKSQKHVFNKINFISINQIRLIYLYYIIAITMFTIL